MIKAIASYVDTPKSATKYKDAEKQDNKIPIIIHTTRIAHEASPSINCRNSNVYCATYPSKVRLIIVASPI